MNRLQLNVLQIIFVNEKFKKVYDNKINISKIITNEKYNQLNNEHNDIRKDLKK